LEGEKPVLVAKANLVTQLSIFFFSGFLAVETS